MEFLWPCKKKKKKINCQSALVKLTTIFVKPIYLKYLCLTSCSWNASLWPPESPHAAATPGTSPGPWGGGQAEPCPQHRAPQCRCPWGQWATKWPPSVCPSHWELWGGTLKKTLLPLEELQVLMNHVLVTLSADGTDPTLIHHRHLRQRPKRTST